jgi:C4-dicarboxylate transporter DctM subunit
MIILASAMLLGHYLSIVDLGGRIAEAIQAVGLGRLGFLFLIMAVLFVLGTFMEVTSMLLIMVPMLIPAMTALNVNPIHFAVLFVIAMEVGLLTPPVGMNLYVVARVGKGSLRDAIVGSLPYVLVLTVLAIVIILMPQIALWLPAALK